VRPLSSSTTTEELDRLASDYHYKGSFVRIASSSSEILRVCRYPPLHVPLPSVRRCNGTVTKLIRSTSFSEWRKWTPYRIIVVGRWDHWFRGIYLWCTLIVYCVLQEMESTIFAIGIGLVCLPLNIPLRESRRLVLFSPIAIMAASTGWDKRDEIERIFGALRDELNGERPVCRDK
jgi:hypothetical protein